MHLVAKMIYPHPLTQILLVVGDTRYQLTDAESTANQPLASPTRREALNVADATEEVLASALVSATLSKAAVARDM